MAKSFPPPSRYSSIWASHLQIQFVLYQLRQEILHQLRLALQMEATDGGLTYKAVAAGWRSVQNRALRPQRLTAMWGIQVTVCLAGALASCAGVLVASWLQRRPQISQLLVQQHHLLHRHWRALQTVATDGGLTS